MKQPPKFNKIVFYDHEEDGIEHVKDSMINGNIPAFLHLIMHNQAVLSYAMDELAEKLDRLTPKSE